MAKVPNEPTLLLSFVFSYRGIVHPLPFGDVLYGFVLALEGAGKVLLQVVDIWKHLGEFSQGIHAQG